MVGKMFSQWVEGYGRVILLVLEDDGEFITFHSNRKPNDGIKKYPKKLFLEILKDIDDGLDYYQTYPQLVNFTGGN
jgi:hypothetical protein